jgi:4-cresol dehydrogenase (hydroxylating)
MSHENCAAFIREASALLGDEHFSVRPDVLSGAVANVTGLRREVLALARPGCTNDVQRLVAIANRTRIPLYPYSRGCNWGLGSRLPVRDGACLVDLSRMDRIREINAEHRYAVVEPGVTQGQLAEALIARDLPLVLNVIGAGTGTSLIGNALERGIGYFASRAGSLSGLEIVLGNGEVLRTGFGAERDCKLTHIYRHGIGPSLDGLFYQSNFGIVTAAGIELLPRHAHRVSVIAKIRDSARLRALVDAFAELRRREVVRMVTHIGNRHRSIATLAPLVYEQMDATRTREAAEAILREEGFGPWSAVCSLAGDRDHVRCGVAAARAALRGIATVSILDDARIEKADRILGALSFLPGARRKRMVLRAVRPIYGLSQGIPTDAPLKALDWAAGFEPRDGPPGNPDLGRAGYLYVLPLFPLEGQIAQWVAEESERRAAARGLEAAMTFNILDERCLELVLSVSFSRAAPDRVAVAHAYAEEMLDLFEAHGYRPYRVAVHQMARVVKKGDLFWETARAIKRALDPNGIIAPGRYSLE